MSLDRLCRYVSVPLIACAAASPAAAQDSPSAEGGQGLWADHSLQLKLRNMFWDQMGHDGAKSVREWGQGAQLGYHSGFTRGAVGLGFDAHVYSALRLDSGRGRAGSRMFPVDRDGSAAGESTTLGGALKAKWSRTQLNVGDVRPYNPVVALADARLMPATARGAMLISQEWDGVLLEGGHLTRGKDFNQTGSHGGFYAGYAGIEGGDISYLGGKFQLREDLRSALYAARYQNLWDQVYGNVHWELPGQALKGMNLDFNLYHSGDQGRALAGDIDVTIWSLQWAYTLGPHTFSVAHQRNEGDQPFDYLAMGGGGFQDSIYLANSSQYADFNGPRERSWRVRYDVKLDDFGMPGWELMARYIRGTGINGSHMAASSPYAYYGTGERHWERDVEVGYLVKSGVMKDLNLRLRWAAHRINGSSDANIDQVRLIANYPLTLF